MTIDRGPSPTYFVCDGCDIGGHAYGAHPAPACVSCIRIVDGTKGVLCATCIDGWVATANECVDWAKAQDESDRMTTEQLVKERLARLKKGEL